MTDILETSCAVGLAFGALLACGGVTDIRDPENAGAGAGTSSGGVSTGGASSPPSAFDGLSCDMRSVLTAQCAAFGCHSAQVPAAFLDLESPNVENRLVNVPATHEHILDGTQTYCKAGELLVNVAIPEESNMLTKVLGTQSCGGIMPVLPRAMTSADIACYRQWIYRLAGK